MVATFSDQRRLCSWTDFAEEIHMHFLDKIVSSQLML